MRTRIRGFIEELLEAELDAVNGHGWAAALAEVLVAGLHRQLKSLWKTCGRRSKFPLDIPRRTVLNFIDNPLI